MKKEKRITTVVLVWDGEKYIGTIGCDPKSKKTDARILSLANSFLSLANAELNKETRK